MRNNQKPKPISKSEKVLQICRLVGITTAEDLKKFKENAKKDGKTTLQALEDYLLEMLED